MGRTFYQMQRGGNMPVARRKVRLLCATMMLNVVIFFLVGVSWNLGRDKSDRPKVRIPSKRFWRKPVPSKYFWNKEQQRLDTIYNPIINSLPSDSIIELPDWLNDTGPVNPCEPDYRVATQISDYNTLPHRFQDFLLHMRCRTYPMLINQPHVCDQKPFLLLVVKSLIPHFDRRQAIRETWGRAGTLANRTVATVFLLGNALPIDHFPDLLGMLGHEAKLHKDLLLWDYRDTFFNLTLKDVLFLEWFSQNCPHAQYVLKGDDDVFVNTFRIIELLEGLSDIKAKDLFIGDVIKDAGPQRDRKLKYFVPESVFTGQYPAYAGGGGYLYSGELALRLHNVSRQVALYPIDDVYTGMCLKKLGLVPENHSGFKTFDIEEKYRDNPCVYRDLMLVHSRTPQDVLKIWPWITHPELDCQ
ncbi:N-acetyllactosaminide beta-1,3-N-acetylglucosaminyltransferase 2a isoform X2 [Perca fluviatilis]|uniref:N-acetyllactosaminide beta-1,3-N-acetylglucosaminyltransferase 2a isoform X2 n=1 Tax=Perca fluviatilis TaxID=8168 RepID=UPI0019653D21|nr:N-acetyllactosaminide beta-1,3-N-acetylglucosaminyltransferase 2a isoform X2 [Perca fluviatilis]XP_039667028.1 N-acetyllactosaminide beta-1,3-N-acetylglucosaminyltransferase 2a isoform X2 [Perca fluviatilis]